MNIYQRLSQRLNRSLLSKLQILVVFIFCIQTLTAQENKVDERPLPVGAKTERQVIGQELHAYSIQLKRGQVLRVVLQEKGADVIAGIEYFANSQPAMASAISNFGTGFMQESLTAIVEQDGIYKLSVIAKQTDDSVDARYEFIASINDSATPNDTQRLQAEIVLYAVNHISATNDKEKMPLAITELEKLVKIWQSVGDKYWEAITKILIGNLSFKTGEFDKAEIYLLQALSSFDKVKNKAEIGNVYAGLGNIYASQKDEVKAKKYFNDALEIARSIGDKRTEKAFSGVNSQSLRNFASSTLTGGGNKKKFSDFEKELNDAKRKNDEAAQLAIWTDYLFAVVFAEAVEAEFPVDKMSIQEISERANKIAEKTLEVYDKGEREGLRLAQKLKDRNAEMQILVLLGLGYCDPDYSDDDADADPDEKPQTKMSEKAKTYLIQGLALTQLQNDKIYETLAHAGLSVMYDGKNDKLGVFFGKKFVNSIHSYRKTFVNMASREDQQFLAKYTEGIYVILATMLIESGRLNEALQVINLARDQEFFDYKLIDNQPPAKLVLTKNESNNEPLFNNLLNEVIAKYANRSNAGYLSAASEIKKVFDTLERNFDARKASEDDIVREVKDAEDMKTALGELSKKTGKNHVAIYYVGADDEDDGFLLVTPENIRFFDDGVYDFPARYKENPDQIYTDFLEVLTKHCPVEENNKTVLRPCFDARPLGSLIYKSIFKNLESADSLEAALEKSKTQVIHWSLSGKLRYIPIAALYDEERKQYLVEQYENVVFTRAKKESFLLPPKRWLTGVGFGRSFANDLPFVREELNAIFGDEATNRKALFTGKVFINENFNADSLLSIRQTKPDFIHIASHFKFQPGEAGKSVLQLGDGKFVSLSEMQLVDKIFDGVDLLTLSACETAVQHADASGKEIDGFAELAQRLGAKSVIATLWSIEDTSASQLMKEFYRLKQENPDASKAEILRLAQMTLLNGEESWDAGLKNRIIESERGVGNKSQNKTNGTNNNLTNIPFTRSSKAPFAHPYYWAPYVLYGGSNGGKTTKTYTIPKPRPRPAANVSEGGGGSNRASVAGTWSGKYVCGQGVTGVTLKIAQNGNEIQGVFEFYPLPENPTFKAGAGLYKGVFDPAFGVMQLNGERWLNQPDLSWVLVGFSGSFDENRQTFSGKMLSSNCGEIELRRQDSNQTSDIPNLGETIAPSRPATVTLKEIEASFKSKLFDETIRLSTIFLQTSPDDKDANAYLGYALLLKKEVDRAIPFLEKAVLLGHSIPFPLKRLRLPLLGHLLESAEIVISKTGVALNLGQSSFQAKFTDLSESGVLNYKNQCTIAHLKGTFTETSTKSEKIKQDVKQFNLFPPGAYLVPTQEGKLIINYAACSNEESFITEAAMKLVYRLSLK